MARIAADIEKMVKKNQESGGGDGFGFGFGFGFGSPSSGDSLVKKKKASEEGNEKDEHREAGVHLKALMEDLFGLSVKSEGEGEKMEKKSAVKNITTSTRGRGGVSIKENEEAKTVKLEIPGLGKEHVKVSVVNNTLLIEGDAVPDENEDGKKNNNNNTLLIEGDAVPDENEDGNKNNNSKWRMYLPEEVYKSEETKALMKNGVLTVVVPKKKVEERKDAIHVVVEG